MRKSRDWGVILSGFGLAGAALLLGAAVTRATLRVPVTAAPPPPTAAAESPAPVSSPVRRAASEELPGEVLSLAVSKAPFDPDRQASGQRYLMPGERVVREPVRVERPEPPPAPDFRVLGTVAGPNGGIAVLQVENEPPRVVSMGTEIRGYRVASILDGGRVVMSGQGRNLALDVPDAMPSGAAAVANQRGQTGRGGQQNGRGQQTGRNAQNQQREVERAQNQVRDRMQTLMQQMQESGVPVQVEMQGDRAFITGPNGQRREIQIPEGVGRVQIGPQGNVTFQRGRGAGGGGE